jgi:energy-coupling factor transporter ATP-binding protein EcfA2
MTEIMPPSPRDVAAAVPEDPRVRAFCSPDGAEVFHAVAHWNDIWRPDPYDVETIHEEARDVFRGLVARASMTPRPTSGRILLLMGESGSGKTHLMRAFRNWAHSERRAYCGYMQMTSAADDYGRYVLNNLIDSLSQTYYEPHGEATGLKRLSTALAESRSIAVERLAQLREDDLDARCLGRLIDALADQIVEDERYDNFDIDLVRALLYLQRDEPRLRGRVLKYLRCEDLSPSDREALGGLTPRTYPAAAERVVTLLGQLMGSVESVPLILCLDQLEAIWNLDEHPNRFRRAMATVCDLVERVPSSVVVISCLEDFYNKLKDHLATPVKARIEQDPRPIRLRANRTLPEVEQLIAKRLEALYQAQGVSVVEDDPTYPIPRDALPAQAEKPTRLILDWCRDFREQCIANGPEKGVRSQFLAGETDSDEASVFARQKLAPDPFFRTTRLEQLWNDFRSGTSHAIPTDDVPLTSLLAWAIEACSDELKGGHHLSSEADGTMIAVEDQGPDQSVNRLLVGICNRDARGGGLARQVEEIEKRTGDATPEVTPVLVRSTEFPSNPKTVISKQIGKLITRGGRRVVVEDSDWRAMQAMRAFRDRHQADPAFPAWLVEEKPLSRLESLRKILALDERKARTTSPSPKPKPPIPARPSTPRVADPVPEVASPLVVGMTVGINPVAVEVEPAELMSHAAFLGATGSGKTTVALSIIEQLLVRGIPAILIDRKGDLCRYADPSAWAGPSPDPAAEARRPAFLERVEVAVYTPGSPDGRPLSIAAVPPGLDLLKSAEREKTAQFAASALGGMMNYKSTRDDQARTVILAKAMDLLSQVRPGGVVTLAELVEFIHSSDPTLVNAIGMLDTKLFARLVQDLETIRHSRGELLSAEGEPMDAEALLGLGVHARPGKTRLSIISTKFLGPAQDVQFWVAQFLMEMARWTSRAPSKTLQAVLLFDEADLYLPAVGKPSTKEPMENLLKRARSAGLGLLLATQSPGDFDYKCRENIRAWFVGRVTQSTALAKMKPMLSDCRIDVESRLPGQTTGEFHLIREGDVTAFRAGRSLVATEQLPEGEILALARRTRSGT